MATKLKNMRLTSVDLVPAGANQEADICLYKSLDGEPAKVPPATRTISKSDPDRYDHIEEFDFP